MFIVGVIILWPVLIVAGFAYFTHIFCDLFDWGNNLFYFNHKIFGPRFLITKEEIANLPEYLAKYKNPRSFFDFKYYSNKVCLGVEIALFVFMLITIVIFAFEYVFIFLLYFFGLYLHLSRHYQLKKLEEK